MKIVIVGGGKVGYYLCKAILERGHNVKLIEKEKSVCEHIANELDITVLCGDGTSIEMLELADTQGADCFIAVSGNDEDNLIACQLAKGKFNVKKTIARSNNPKNIEIMEKLGIDIPVSSTGIIANLIEHEVSISGLKYIASIIEGQAELYEINLKKDAKCHNTKISTINLPKTCSITAITRKGKVIIPRGDTVLKGGDTVILLSSLRNPNELEKYFV